MTRQYNDDFKPQSWWQADLKCCKWEGNHRDLMKMTFFYQDEFYWIVLTPFDVTLDQPMFSVDGYGLHCTELEALLKKRYWPTIKELFYDWQRDIDAYNRVREESQNEH